MYPLIFTSLDEVPSQILLTEFVSLKSLLFQALFISVFFISLKIENSFCSRKGCIFPKNFTVSIPPSVSIM